MCPVAASGWMWCGATSKISAATSKYVRWRVRVRPSRIRLPLTLAILDGQLVRVGGETYIIPLVSIIESLQMQGAQVSSVVNSAELYKLRDAYIPVVTTLRTVRYRTGQA